MSSWFKKKTDPQLCFGLARVIEYEELKKATNSFKIVLGKGGYGKVYQGKLQDGQMVAVKVLFDRKPERIEQFFNEVALLSRIRHKNLIGLYGCTDPTTGKLFLVYEFVPNGTLADHLHRKRSALNFALRIQIAVETAEALAYLHALEPPVIHRDVKTDNILLDHEFHVKVADFGICRLLPWDATHVSAKPCGTHGYRDPEYEDYSRLTNKTDVYSFGVVLLELISGQQAVDVEGHPEDVYLFCRAPNKVLSKKLEELVDPKLGYDSNTDLGRMVTSVAELACECLQPTALTRPSMLHVLNTLKGIQNEMRQIGMNELAVLSLEPQQKPNDVSLNTGTPHDSQSAGTSEKHNDSASPMMTPTTFDTALLDDIIYRLLEIGRAGKKVMLSETEIRQLCLFSTEIFLQQPTLLELAAPVKVCGDIHGQYSDLLKLFEHGGFPPAANYLFMGNYVDYGKQSLETICLLLAYKIKYPENFFLLRGNHECASMNRKHGFYDECKRRYNVRLWKLFIRCFNCLPVAALIDDEILCMHGGLSPDLTDLDEIRHVCRPTDIPDQGLLCDLLWSDPNPEAEGWGLNDAGVSYTFGPEVVSRFLSNHGLSLVCRGHQVVQDGYEFFADKQLVTLFSAPSYRGEFDNCGAIMCIDESLMCSFQLLKHMTRR